MNINSKQQQSLKKKLFELLAVIIFAGISIQNLRLNLSTLLCDRREHYHNPTKTRLKPRKSFNNNGFLIFSTFDNTLCYNLLYI